MLAKLERSGAPAGRGRRPARPDPVAAQGRRQCAFRHRGFRSASLLQPVPAARRPGCLAAAAPPARASAVGPRPVRRRAPARGSPLGAASRRSPVAPRVRCAAGGRRPHRPSAPSAASSAAALPVRAGAGESRSVGADGARDQRVGKPQRRSGGEHVRVGEAVGGVLGQRCSSSSCERGGMAHCRIIAEHRNRGREPLAWRAQACEPDEHRTAQPTPARAARSRVPSRPSARFRPRAASEPTLAPGTGFRRSPAHMRGRKPARPLAARLAIIRPTAGLTQLRGPEHAVMLAA